MKEDHLGLRADPQFVDRIDSVGERYGWDRSKTVRKLMGHSLTIVEDNGIDALIDAAEGGLEAFGDGEAVAES